MKKEFLTARSPLVAAIRAVPDKRILKFGSVFVFFLSLLICDLLSVLLYIIALGVWKGMAGAGKVRQPDEADEMILSLLLTSVCIVWSCLFVRLIERRPLPTAGVRSEKMPLRYGIGICAGFGAFGSAVLLAWAAGGLRYDGIAQPVPWGRLAVFLAVWLIQGFSEEIAFRGWLMTSLCAHSSPAKALLISSIAFAAAHLGNDGIGPLPLINLTLFGILAGLYLLRTGSIWGPAAMHALWNFAQGNVFGIKVSGFGVTATLWNFASVPEKDLLHGGAFGMEGGIAVTAVLAAGILLLYLTAGKAAPQTEP